jgi:hypothetical protein
VNKKKMPELNGRHPPQTWVAAILECARTIPEGGVEQKAHIPALLLPSSISARPLTATDQPLLWNMLYHALFVPDGAAPFPPEIVQLHPAAVFLAGAQSCTENDFRGA